MLMISALMLVLVVSPALAQRGGGGHGGGGGGGHFGGGGGGHSFSGGMASHGGGFGGHAFSGHVYSGARAGSGYAGRSSTRAYSTRPGFSSRPYSSSAARGYSRYNRNGTGVRIRTYGYGSYGRGLWGYGGYGYPWWYYPGYYDPYWFWDSDSSDDSGAQYSSPQSGYGYDNGLANDLDDPGPPPPYDDVPDNYARSAPAQLPQQRGSSVVPPTVLVFRDHHKEEVQNYAIVGQTLWNFAPQRTEKIPLSTLDIPATTKANDDRGVDFRLPVTQGKLSLEIQSDSIN